ncbi:MAG TPA: hypothetical protein VF954_07565, partial [Acidimicrobiales bacterium]
MSASEGARTPAGRRFPGAAAYREALQHPDLCLSDPVLASSTVELTDLGLPRAVSGNFATVFQVTDASGRRHALRCFVRCPDDIGERYEALARHLRGIPDEWNVGFDYQERGIRVGREWYPIVRSRWLQGQALSTWISDHLWDADAIAGLAVRFAGLVDRLRHHGVAHGDLQHGNILIDAQGELRLVDYDGMYVPGLAGSPSNELGHRNYQHPRRTAQDWGPHLDHFATWVIYTSLLSLSVDPLLWGRLDAGDEGLLFRWHDFADPEHSAAFACLESRPDSTLAELASTLRDFVSRSVDQLPALPDLSELLPDPLGRPVATGETLAGPGSVATLAGVGLADANCAGLAPGPAREKVPVGQGRPSPGRHESADTSLAAARARVAELTGWRSRAKVDEGDVPALRAEQRQVMDLEASEV